MTEKILKIVSETFEVSIDKLTSNSHEISICNARCACLKMMLYCGVSKDEALRVLNITKNTGNNALARYDKLFLENRVFTDRSCKAILLLDGLKIENNEVKSNN